MSFVVPRTVTLQQPPRITFGPHSAEAALNELARTGRYKRVFVCASPSVRSHAEKLTAPFRATSAAVEIVATIPPEPTASLCETLRARAKSFSPDLVLAIGGGSVLDVAKLVAALHDRPESVDKFYGIGVLAGRRTALICVPTTAGTGSEVSPNALLFDEPTSSKKAIISPALVPDAAIVDPALMVSLPPALTATVGIDALTHCLEAYANQVAHPLVDPYALEGVRLIGAHLAQAVANGHDLEARSAVALGSLYGGLCLGPVNTAGVHALAYPLGGEFHLAHGVSIALMLPHVVRFNCSVMPARHAALARALGAHSDGDQALAAELPHLLEKLIAACGLTGGLSAHGIPREALGKLVEGGLAVTRLLKNNPREITRVDALQIYEASF
ncbi:iron-containing alcohol dehydrogenase [Oleiharenicola lentus]|uniref:iron-containing alcohol dehydrogenase n=1 Tax=Oleiharenicola lentus TaxID=2508720 RepID=UPI003F6772A0